MARYQGDTVAVTTIALADRLDVIAPRRPWVLIGSSGVGTQVTGDYDSLLKTRGKHQ